DGNALLVLVGGHFLHFTHRFPNHVPGAHGAIHEGRLNGNTRLHGEVGQASHQGNTGDIRKVPTQVADVFPHFIVVLGQFTFQVFGGDLQSTAAPVPDHASDNGIGQQLFHGGCVIGLHVPG